MSLSLIDRTIERLISEGWDDSAELVRSMATRIDELERDANRLKDELDKAIWQQNETPYRDHG